MENNSQNIKPKFTDVFLSERDANGKRYLATWVYSVLLLLSLFISILAIPALSNKRVSEDRNINLQLEGTSSVDVIVGPNGINSIKVSQPKQPKNATINKDFEGESWMSSPKSRNQLSGSGYNSNLNTSPNEPARSQSKLYSNQPESTQAPCPESHTGMPTGRSTDSGADY